MALRQKLVKMAMVTDKIASIFFIATPVLFVIVRSPGAIFGMVALGISLLAIRVVVHLVTLPVEWDASFRRAMPILQAGYLSGPDLAAARHILLACAFTYVAASLMSVFNIWRWIALLRR